MKTAVRKIDHLLYFLYGCLSCVPNSVWAEKWDSQKKVSSNKPNAKPKPNRVLVLETKIMAGIICLGYCPSGRNLSTA